MSSGRIVIVAHKAEQCLIESCFCSFGFDVCSFEQPGTLKKGAAGLVVTTRAWLDHAGPEALKKIEQFCVAGKTHLLVIGKAGRERFCVPTEYLAPEINLSELHELLRRCCKGYSRRHLRLNTRLPGVISRADSCHICEITNLSAGGAFIRTGTPLGGEKEITLHIPLLGMKRELELGSQVVFQILPSEQNNFQQGVGLKFADGDPHLEETLHTFIVHLHGDRATQTGLISPTGDAEANERRRSHSTGRERRMTLHG